MTDAEDPQRTAWRAEVEHRLAAIAALEADWDSYGAGPVPQASIDRARDFLHAVEVLRLAYPDIDLPSICPTASGGVDLEWLPPGGAWACVELTADGRIEATGHDAVRTNELSYGFQGDEQGAP